MLGCDDEFGVLYCVVCGVCKFGWCLYLCRWNGVGGIGLGLCVVDIVRTTLADLFNLSSPFQRCYFSSFVVMFPVFVFSI